MQLAPEQKESQPPIGSITNARKPESDATRFQQLQVMANDT